MQELCKKDGGVTVYEKVTLPKAAFDDTGRLITGEFRRTSDHRTLIPVGREYLIERNEEVIKGRRDPSFEGAFPEGRLLRFITTIRRNLDGKVMGIEITYGRTGGDLTLGHPGQNFCPKPRPNPGVEHAVFVKGD